MQGMWSREAEKLTGVKSEVGSSIEMYADKILSKGLIWKAFMSRS